MKSIARSVAGRSSSPGATTQNDNMPDDFQPPSDPPVRSRECSAALTGENLHKIWSDSCPWSSVGFERDWCGMHPHRKAKWQALADEILKRLPPNSDYATNG